MAEEVRASIMVLAHKESGETKLDFLIERDGIWQDTPALGGSSLPPEQVRDAVDRQLSTTMQQVGEKRSKNEPLPPLETHLKNVFGMSYRELLPGEVQTYLKGAAERAKAEGQDAVLRIHMQEGAEWIPWEMLYDGEEFLGMRFQISRLPITIKGPDLTAFRRQQLKVYSLLGQSVVGVPADDALMRAWRKTFSDLPFVVERVWWPAEGDLGADSWPSITQFTEAGKSDIIHLTCHGGLKDQKGNVYWSLNPENEWQQNYSINSDAVSLLGLRSSRPLVFGNACASAAGNNGGAAAGLTPGLGMAFFMNGALNFIGTIAPVTKQIAFDFACQFYKRLLNDEMPIGKALLETKKLYQGNKELDPSWYFYCMYGPHDTRFIPSPPPPDA